MGLQGAGFKVTYDVLGIATGTTLNSRATQVSEGSAATLQQPCSGTLEKITIIRNRKHNTPQTP